jgi:hypothetical protein
MANDRASIPIHDRLTIPAVLVTEGEGVANSVSAGITDPVRIPVRIVKKTQQSVASSEM